MNPNTDLIIYTTDDGITKVKATFDGDTVWLSQEQMAELFQRDKSTISRHIRNIFTEGELDEKVVVAEIATTSPHGAMEGKTQSNITRFYNRVTENFCKAAAQSATRRQWKRQKRISQISRENNCPC